MKKIKVKERIFTKRIGEGNGCRVHVSDLPEYILPTDIINILRDEGYYSDNNSWDPFTQLEVYREREETDVEFELRVDSILELKERSRKKRYETYLEYKKEFNPDTTTNLKAKIAEWDELAKDNEDNKHNLSTSERQDWANELNDLIK